MKPSHRRMPVGIDEPPGVPAQETDIGARMRDAQDRRRTFPKAVAVIPPEIRSAVGTEVAEGDGAQVETVTELLEYRQRPLAKSVAAGKIGRRPVTKTLFDPSGQCLEL